MAKEITEGMYVKYTNSTSYRGRVFLVVNTHPMVIQDFINPEGIEVYVRDENIAKIVRAPKSSVRDYHKKFGKKYLG